MEKASLWTDPFSEGFLTCRCLEKMTFGWRLQTPVVALGPPHHASGSVDLGL